MYPRDFFQNGFPPPGPLPPGPLPKGGLPFKAPTLRSATRLASKKSLGAVKKFSLSSMLDTSTKAINTFNSFIPIYHEIKPLVENTKGITKTIKSALSRTKKPVVKKEEVEVVEPEIVEPPKPPKSENLKDHTEPDKPFFG